VLTQGDVILISYLASLQAQGVYALASNYGGLVARMVFQPIEESSRNYFGKLLSSIDGPPSNQTVYTASKDLHNLLRFYLLLSLCAVSLGPTIAPLILKLIAGSRWISSGAGNVLAHYCYYIPLLAVNGITEAFISAVASESELNTQSIWMLAFSAGFGAAGYVLLYILELGAKGLVWANIINMAFRILWSSAFIDRYLAESGSKLSIADMLPQKTSIALGVGTAAVLSQLRASFTGGLEDFIKSALVAAGFVLIL
jgi:oligosaccharide translocation protein RFT1